MKLYCPKCQHTINIGEQSRFFTFKCPSCSHSFCGINANGTDEGIVRSFFSRFNPFRTPPFTTDCPFCGALIRLGKDDNYIGVLAPECCWSCRRRLPE